MKFQDLVNLAGAAFEAAGMAAMVGGAVFSLGLMFLDRQGGLGAMYQSYRHRLGRSIILGLELLVAADILRTISTVPSLERVFVLGMIVLIRTFLSFSLEVELEGRWPWQRGSPGGRG